MSLQVKQCASCGAQMGSLSRECPRCGRGSLFGELGMFAFLGLLLLGIGLASGLIPLDRVRQVAGPTLPDTLVAAPRRSATAHAPAKAAPRRAKAASPVPRSPDSTAAYVAPDPHADELAKVVSVAQCARPDTALIRRLLDEPAHTNLDRIAAQACDTAGAEASKSAEFITARRLPRSDSTQPPAQP